MFASIQGKRVLFISTKNLDYIRNTQEINLLQSYAVSFDVLGSNSQKYLNRLIHIYSKLLFLNIRKYDVIFIGFAPQLILPIFHRKFKEKQIIVDFFISMYDTFCCDRQKFKTDSIVGKLFHRLDSFTLKKCDIVVCDTNAHATYFSEEFHADSLCMHTLYLEADLSLYHPMTVPRPDYLQDKFIVLYFGSILPLQGIDTVLQAFDYLKNKENIYFYCIGPVKEKDLTISKPISERIKYIDWLSQEDLAQYIAMSDLCLAGHFHPTIKKAQRTIPGKAYIYHAMKKPMILGDNPANHELFDNDNSVIFVEMGNARALANEILRQSTKQRLS